MEKYGDNCQYCGIGQLVERNSKFGSFLGCDRYPQCAGKSRTTKRSEQLEEEARILLRQSKKNNH